jgi:hypothetical protein
MKKLLLIASFAMILHVLFAEQPISISGGIKLIGTQTGDITLWYIDDSPSRDHIYSNIDQIGDFAINLNLRWINDKSNNPLKFFLEGQGYIGGINGLAISGGYLYNKSQTRKVRIQPELSGTIGFCSKRAGKLENNDVYIQVNQTRFQDYSDVFVSIRNIYLGIKPGLSLIFKTKNYTEVGFGVNYQLSIKSGYVSFSGTGQDGNQVSDYENLTANNVGFYVNGNKTSSNPFNPDGLEFKMFYTF